jgi:hypothetical protein
MIRAWYWIACATDQLVAALAAIARAVRGGRA